MIQIKRAYDPAAPDDGTRYLVDRLWPRGVKKEELHVDEWIKEVAPSTALRKWFGHDPDKWPEFQKRYTAELEQNPDGWQPIADAARKGRVTLVYSAKDEAHNDAVVLKSYLERKLAGRA
ncbi:MAG: hypothetical protein DCC57_12550 [Chloroflexi bacterium]|nr:MAG: hypothetical protein DCC57_12550 [Chloroflexota bacterium]